MAKEIERKFLIKRELATLCATIPQEILDDLYTRRAHNIMTTELLLHGVESGDFDYLLIGRDDTATFSQAHREARSMEILVSELPKERIRFFAGADQLGLVLLTRAAKRLQYGWMKHVAGYVSSPAVLRCLVENALVLGE